MKAYTIQLKDEYSFLRGGELHCQIIEDSRSTRFEYETPWRRPALIVVPGGGYSMTSRREAEPVSTAFTAKGFQTFVVRYLCAPQNVRYPEQLLELSAAVDYVRKHAEELCVNPDEIFVVGFSAGGHLTGNLANAYQSVEKLAGVALDCKPTAVGLCYPVISPRYGHTESHENLLNGYSEAEKAALEKSVNLDEAVGEQTPPCFVWTTAEDALVPCENALRYALALTKQKIPFELHVYPRGPHGLTTGSKEVNVPHPDLDRISRWVDDCSAFFHLYTEEVY